MYVMLGGIPYPAVVFSPGRDGLAADVEEAVLLEHVPGTVTASLATSGFEAGTVFPCVIDGKLHPTDNRRLLHPCDASTGDRTEDGGILPFPI